MYIEDVLFGFVAFASILALVGAWLAWRVAGLLRRQRIAELMLRERLAHWKARVARESAAAQQPARAD